MGKVKTGARTNNRRGHQHPVLRNQVSKANNSKLDALKKEMSMVDVSEDAKSMKNTLEPKKSKLDISIAEKSILDISQAEMLTLSTAEANSKVDSPEASTSTIEPKTTVKRKRQVSDQAYDDVTLKKALDAVNAGMPVNTAATLHGIPRSTLRGKISGRLPPVCAKSRGPECILGDENERHLVYWILYMSQNGFPGTREQLLDSVQLLLNHQKKNTVFKDNRPGRSWYESFRARHTELSERMSQNLSHSRASVSEAKLRAWFNEVQIYFESKQLIDIHPSRVFNCDESAFFLSPKGNTVLAKRGDKTVYNFINNDEKECLTTLFCGNADGLIAPPMVVFSYKRISGHIAANMPEGWSIGHSENGWMTGETLYEYVANIFHPWLVKNGVAFPVILFLDGHSSHLTMPLSDFCKEHQIEIVALYPNATHILQPLDVAFFHPLKTAWAKVVRNWRIENNGKRIKREKFAELLQSAVESLDVKSILQNGFAKTGLHPFSANSISYDKYFMKPVESEPVQEAVRNDSAQTKEAFLVYLENNIEQELLQRFRNVNEEEEWNGETNNISLFNMWRRVKRNINSNGTSKNTFGNEMGVVTEKGDLICSDDTAEQREEIPETLDVTQNAESGPNVVCDNILILSSETQAHLDVDLNEHIEIYEVNLAGAFVPIEKHLNDELQIDNQTEESIIIDKKDEKLQEINCPNSSTPKLESQIPSNIPSPFKAALFWPSKNTVISKKGKANEKPVKEKVPSVLTSEKWIQYQREKDEKKRNCLKKKKQEKKSVRKNPSNEKSNKKSRKRREYSKKKNLHSEKGIVPSTIYI